MRPVAGRGNVVPVDAFETGHRRGEPRIEPRRVGLWTFGCASARDARASCPDRRGRSDTPMSPHGGARLRRRGRTFCRPSQRRSARDGCGRRVSTSRSGISSGPRLLSSARRSSREGWWGRCTPCHASRGIRKADRWCAPVGPARSAITARRTGADASGRGLRRRVPLRSRKIPVRIAPRSRDPRVEAIGGGAADDREPGLRRAAAVLVS